ncbi:IS4 family transposase [Agrobacterium larrymoorei]|uniref:IS4 family transposase n=1 Tax=Agrobacterium larrymoorei TaxID=160699 RepID=A0AAF0KFJ5_9HYPH|nr:IS4 family transposase [Agrobacterium larrymoorei]WHA43136.1 IS4 family transposase [Agrobacterium larrymoorei]
MRHQNSVFHQIQKHVPWQVFEGLVDKYKGDHRVRRFSMKDQLLALLFAQLSGAQSLREIEAGLSSHRNQLYHLGAHGVARSTLADANATRPAGVFADLFSHMAAAASRRTRRHIRDAVRLLDATRVALSSMSDGWADMVSGRRAAKLHVAYDPNGDIPMAMTMTGQRTNDIVPAKAMPIEPGMTYVFDLAYYDFAWWAALDRAGCRFVTQLKTNTHLQAATEQPPSESDHILCDRIGLLAQRMARSRRNPFSEPLREIAVRIDTGRTIRLVTNDLDAPAEEIAELYKQRWQIELFFKWVKQNLRIRHFFGASENAVRIQTYVALIAYLVLRMAQACQSAITQPLTFTRLVRLNLMHKRRSDQLLKPPTQPSKSPNQMVLMWD